MDSDFFNNLNRFKLVKFFKQTYSDFNNRISKLSEFIKGNIVRDIRMQIIATVFFCISISLIFFFVSSFAMINLTKRAVIDYTQGIEDLNKRSEKILGEISNNDYSLKDKDSLDKLISKHLDREEKLLITDLDGNVLYKNESAVEKKVDIYSVMKKIMQTRLDFSYNNNSDVMSANKEYLSIYPIDANPYKVYMIVKAIPSGTIKYYVNDNEFVYGVSLILSIILFFSLFFALTKEKVLYIKEISYGLLQISKGDLEYKVRKKGEDELSLLAENINYMSQQLSKKIQEERRLESVKNELITNVSHDLRTPLTSIMGYLGLVKDTKKITEEQKNEYLNTAFNKAKKLKVLIDDLFEYTKVSHKGILLKKEIIPMNQMVDQILEEFIPILEEKNLFLEKQIMPDNILCKIDSDKIFRVFDNLIMNAIKYSLNPSILSVETFIKGGKWWFCIENQSENLDEIDFTKMFERFYKKDKSRNSKQEGSGLGLAIAKSIVDLHSGYIGVERTKEDKLKFYVGLKIFKG